MDEVLRFCLENTDPAAPAAGEAIEVSEGVYFFSATPQMRQLRAQSHAGGQVRFSLCWYWVRAAQAKKSWRSSFTNTPTAPHRTFLKINCAAVPSELLESELFGYEPGARSPAPTNPNPASSSCATKVRLLLDEIGEMSPALQAKFLQVLAGRPVLAPRRARHRSKSMSAFWPPPTSTCRKPSRRRPSAKIFITASTASCCGCHRLRERREEIPMILRHFMIQLADKYACAPLSVSQRLVEATENYSWPGNIRELENFVKRYLVLGDEVHGNFRIAARGRARHLRRAEREPNRVRRRRNGRSNRSLT
jgi:two-component system, NtrC family, response regulator AtoC